MTVVVALPVARSLPWLFELLFLCFLQGDRRCELSYREAIRLRPQYSSAWANLGLVLINTGLSQLFWGSNVG